jgi:hypothetical protein
MAAGDGKRTTVVASVRHLDEFVRQEERWLLAERRLLVSRIGTRLGRA